MTIIPFFLILFVRLALFVSLATLACHSSDWPTHTFSPMPARMAVPESRTPDAPAPAQGSVNIRRCPRSRVVAAVSGLTQALPPAPRKPVLAPRHKKPAFKLNMKSFKMLCPLLPPAGTFAAIGFSPRGLRCCRPACCTSRRWRSGAPSRRCQAPRRPRPPRTAPSMTMHPQRPAPDGASALRPHGSLSRHPCAPTTATQSGVPGAPATSAHLGARAWRQQLCLRILAPARGPGNRARISRRRCELPGILFPRRSWWRACGWRWRSPHSLWRPCRQPQQHPAPSPGGHARARPVTARHAPLQVAAGSYQQGQLQFFGYHEPHMC